MEDILVLFGEKVKARILSEGYPTIELFAHEHNIPKSTLSELIRGKNDPRLTTFFKICAALNTTPSEFLKDEDIDLWVKERAPDYRTKTPKSHRLTKKKPRKALT